MAPRKATTKAAAAKAVYNLSNRRSVFRQEWPTRGQLLLQASVPALFPDVGKAIDAEPGISEKSLKEQFEKLIFEPLKAMQISIPILTLVIVVDALDECDQEEHIRTILHLLFRTRDLQSVRVRIFLTSRPELPIRHEFKKMSADAIQEVVLQDIPQLTIEHDISVYLTDELARIKNEYDDICSPDPRLPSDWPGDGNIKALAAMAVPSFIFAATVCRFIGDRIWDWDPEERLLTLLKYQTTSQASKLDRTYLPVLQQFVIGRTDSEKERLAREFREIIGSIVILADPLPTSSLARLLGILEKDVNSRLRFLHSVLSIPSDRDFPVRLLHLSFRDFLLDSEKQGKSEFWFSVHETKTHDMIAIRCLELMRKCLKKDMCGLELPGKLRHEIDSKTLQDCLPPDVRYACQYWVHHLEQGGNRIHDQDVHVFLQQHFLHWLEALSLMGKISQSIALTGTLQSLLAANGGTEISRFLYDARRFVLQGRSIVDTAPLQLYSSAIIFAPETSIIRTIFKDQIPRWIHRLPKVPSAWSPELQTLEGHTGSVNAVAFSCDSQLLASASDDGTVRLWNPETGEQKETLEGHTGSVNAVSFSCDGQLLASASDDGTVRLWNPATGEQKEMFEGHTDRVNAVAFSCDGQLLASASRDGMVRLWSPATGEQKQKLEGHSNWVTDVAFSHDGQLLASASYDDTVKLWNSATGEQKQTLEGHTEGCGFYAVAFSHDGQLLASASSDDTVKLWNPATGEQKQTLEGHTDGVQALAFSRDGQLLASASNVDDTVRLWNPATREQKQTLKGHTDGVNAVAFSCDGQLLASASSDSTVRLWNPVMEEQKQTLEGHTDRVNAMAFSRDGQLLASAPDDCNVRLWNPATGELMQTLKGHTGRVEAMAFSHDGQLLASTSRDCTVRLWNSATGEQKQTLKGHTDWVYAVAFSYENQLLASASGDHTIRLWNPVTGEQKQTLKGHTDRVNAVAFSRDGQLLASASHDDTIRLWNRATGEQKHEIDVDTVVSKICFSSDRQCLETDRGILRIPSASSTILSPEPKLPDDVFFSDHWITRNGRNYLWFPHENRGCSALKENVLVIGQRSGLVNFIELNFEKYGHL